MADMKWIKLATDIPDNMKIKRIRRLPDGNNVILFWVFLLARAGDSNSKGGLFISESLPYTTEDLADDFNFSIEFVTFALLTLEKNLMIEIYEDIIFIKNWEEYQSVDKFEKIREQNRIRAARHREKQKQLALENKSNVTDNVIVTENNATELELELELDKEKNSRKYSDEHLRLATKLRDNLIKDFPNKVKKANVEAWANDIRLLEEKDKEKIESIEYVIDWLPANDFWSANVLSGKKLRIQFERLKKEIKTSKKPKQYSNEPKVTKPNEIDVPEEWRT